MKYPIGTEVLLVHIGDRGRIIDCDADGVYKVRLNDGFEIPAFEDDLRDISHGFHPDAIAKVQYNQKQVEKPSGPELLHASAPIKDPKGIYIALVGLAENDGSILYYQVWIINEMSFPVIAELDVYYGSETIIKVGQKLVPFSAFNCGKLHYDDLNDHPDMELSIQRISTEGLDKAFVKTHRLKGKSVVGTSYVLAIIDKPGWRIEMFGTKQLEANATEIETDLTEYAKKVKPKLNNKSSKYMPIRDIKEMAAFQGEIDLHIEALVAHKGKMNNGEILSMQLLHFESFMDKAARMASKNVFIIHGVGEGVLRAAISDRLKQRHDVLKFHNQYHPKYGYGATEVIFK